MASPSAATPAWPTCSTHEEIKPSYPALWVATRAVGTPQIRNMATVAGNLLQRPRCWYYRNGFGLLGGRRNEQGQLIRELEGEFTPTDFAKGDPGHLVRKGDNRYHAIFMTDQDALFVSPSNLAPALIALGAKATVVGTDGKTRTIPVEDLYKVPTAEEERELTVQQGELLTEVMVPASKGKNATYEVRWKQSHDWPLVVACVCCEMDGDKVSKARIVHEPGGADPVPQRGGRGGDHRQGDHRGDGRRPPPGPPSPRPNRSRGTPTRSRSPGPPSGGALLTAAGKRTGRRAEPCETDTHPRAPAGRTLPPPAQQGDVHLHRWHPCP